MMEPGRDWQDLVRQFYEKYQRPVRGAPTTALPPGEVRRLRALLLEEVKELEKAMFESNLTKIADGIGDVLYVVLGMSLQYGLDADAALRAVHESNMTRQEPRSAHTDYNKVPRGDDYVPPEAQNLVPTKSREAATEVRPVNTGE